MWSLQSLRDIPLCLKALMRKMNHILLIGFCIWRNKPYLSDSAPSRPTHTSPLACGSPWTAADLQSSCHLHSSRLLLFHPHTFFFPTSLSPSVMDYMSPRGPSCPRWIMTRKPRVDLRVVWELQETEGKLQILGFCALSSRYDVVSVSTDAQWGFSVSQIVMNLWWERDKMLERL